MILAVTTLEAILIVIPGTITAIGGAIAAIVAAKHGSQNKAKLEMLDKDKLQPIKDAVNGTPT